MKHMYAIHHYIDPIKIIHRFLGEILGTWPQYNTIQNMNTNT